MIKKTACVVVAAVMAMSGVASAGLFENKKVSGAFADNKVTIGMTKDALVSLVGYPPEGKAKQDALFYRFAQSKVTAAGKEESWTYQLGATSEGVRSITVKLVDGKVTEWNEWLDSGK